MNIKTFEDLPIGARFKQLSCDSVAVYTKTSTEYTIDSHSGYPIPNASSGKFGLYGFSLDSFVLDLTSEEVVKAEALEDIYRVGKELADKAALLYKGGFYVKVKVLEPEKPNDEF